MLWGARAFLALGPKTNRRGLFPGFWYLRRRGALVRCLPELEVGVLEPRPPGAVGHLKFSQIGMGAGRQGKGEGRRCDSPCSGRRRGGPRRPRQPDAVVAQREVQRPQTRRVPQPTEGDQAQAPAVLGQEGGRGRPSKDAVGRGAFEMGVRDLPPANFEKRAQTFASADH